MEPQTFSSGANILHAYVSSHGAVKAVLMHKVLSLLLVLASNGVLAADVAGSERVLVPISASAQGGAFNSRWTSELWFYSTAEPPGIGGYKDSQCTECTPLPPPPLPDHTASRLDLFATLPDSPPGAILYAVSSTVDQLWFRLIVRDTVSGSSFTLPVVREKDFFRGTTTYPMVESGGSRRVTLRIYAMEDVANPRFTVRVSQGRNVVAEVPVTAWSVPQTVVRGPVKYSIRPLAVEIPLSSVTTVAGRLTLEVIPVDASTPYWTFISVTDNVSQAIDVLTPN